MTTPHTNLTESEREFVRSFEPVGKHIKLATEDEAKLVAIIRRLDTSLLAANAEVAALKEALQAIEIVSGDDYCEDLNCRIHLHPERKPDVSSKDALDCETKLTQIYRISHAEVSDCKGTHESWRQEKKQILTPPTSPSGEKEKI